MNFVSLWLFLISKRQAPWSKGADNNGALMARTSLTPQIMLALFLGLVLLTVFAEPAFAQVQWDEFPAEFRRLIHGPLGVSMSLVAIIICGFMAFTRPIMILAGLGFAGLIALSPAGVDFLFSTLGGYDSDMFD